MWRVLLMWICICLSITPTVEAVENAVPSKAAKLEVTFFDVGQGDATLLVLPNGKSILIDGGPVEEGERLVKKLQTLGIETLDLVIATHPDYDHIGGLLTVFRKIPVKKILDSGKKYDSKTYKQYIRMIQLYKIPVQKAKSGNNISPDSTVFMKVLNDGRKKAENNESSIVIKTTYKKADFLLTGDADVFVEREILAKKYNIQAEVLKVGHHGSYTSTSSKFLEKIGPLFGVISYKEHNEHGHPHKVVLDRLLEQKVQVYETAKDGDITVETDGEYLKIEKSQPILLH